MRVLLTGLFLVATSCSGGAVEPTGPERAGVDRHHRHHHGSGEHADHDELKFTNADEWAKVFDDPERDAWQKPSEVVELLALEPGMTVADLGAGTGYFVVPLARAVGPSGKVLGLDVEADMIRYMKERAAKEGLKNVEPVLVPFDDPELPPDAIDRVLIVNTWHHVGKRREYAKKLAAGLKPGGFVAVVDFTMESEKGPPKNHRVLPEKVIEELAAGGLVGEVAKETLPDQYVVVARRPSN